MSSEHKLGEGDPSRSLFKQGNRDPDPASGQEPQGAGRDVMRELEEKDPTTLGEELELSAMDAEVNRVASEEEGKRIRLKYERDSMQAAAVALEELLRDGKFEPTLPAEIFAEVLSNSIGAIQKNPKPDQRKEYKNEIAVCGSLYALMDEYGIDRVTPAGELVGIFKERAEKLGEEFKTMWGSGGGESG